MKTVLLSCVLCTVASSLSLAQANRAARALDDALKSEEREVVGLVEAMPPEKFGFAPRDGAFERVRTFGMQAKHIAYVLDELSSDLLGEKNPSKTGANENGPDELTTKDEIDRYLKEAFAYTHKALATLTEQNVFEEIQNPFGGTRKMTRLEVANIALWHTYDHYGQMVVYARMNNVVPPASR